MLRLLSGIVLTLFVIIFFIFTSDWYFIVISWIVYPVIMLYYIIPVNRGRRDIVLILAALACAGVLAEVIVTFMI